MFKCFRQIEHSDCGLTCIRMIAKSYGKRIPLKYLHSISDLNRLGMSIKDIKVGNHLELIARNGDYWRLVKNQLPLSV